MQTDQALGSSFTRVSFLALAFFVLALMLCAIVLANRRHERQTHAAAWTVGGVTWLGLWCAIAEAGYLQRWEQMPPPMALTLVSVFVAALGLAFSSVGTRVAGSFEFKTLIAAQTFRLPLELLMYQALREGVMPSQMSFEGNNLDVLAGVLALVCWLWRGPLPRWMVWTFSVLGTSTLLNVLGVALMSMPPIAYFGPERTVTWVTHYPYVTLPCVMVLAALSGHLIIWRKLLGRERRLTISTDPAS
jgi:hypothetical protein